MFRIATPTFGGVSRKLRDLVDMHKWITLVVNHRTAKGERVVVPQLCCPALVDVLNLRGPAALMRNIEIAFLWGGDGEEAV